MEPLYSVSSSKKDLWEMPGEIKDTLKELIESKGLPQMRVAATIGLVSTELSSLLNGRFLGLSVSKMMAAIVALGQEIQIVIGLERVSSAIRGDTQRCVEIIQSEQHALRGLFRKPSQMVYGKDNVYISLELLLWRSPKETLNNV